MCITLKIMRASIEQLLTHRISIIVMLFVSFLFCWIYSIRAISQTARKPLLFFHFFALSSFCSKPIYENLRERVHFISSFFVNSKFIESNPVWMTEVNVWNNMKMRAVIQTEKRAESSARWAKDEENVLWLLERFNWTQLNWTELNWIRNKYNIIRLRCSPKASLKHTNTHIPSSSSSQ